MAVATQAQTTELELIDEIAQCWDDPLRYVMLAFPWGEKGGPLEDQDGPDDWQVEQLNAIRDHIRSGNTLSFRDATSSGHGIGKAQRLDDVVPTPSGDRRWGDLKPGDYVFGGDGIPVRIRATRLYESVPMLRVHFDDRTTLDVSTGHQFSVRGCSDRRSGRHGYRVMTAQEIMTQGVKRANGTARQWEIPVQGPAQYPAREVPIDPYLMGVWLGDGTRGVPRFTKPCPEVVERVASGGYVVTSIGASHYVKGMTRAMTDPVFDLHSHGRYVPEDYKHNSQEVRTAVLQGLLDTDGEVLASGGSIGYATTSPRLAEDVLWLARSLGWKAMLQPTTQMPHYPGPDGEPKAGRPCHRVTINAPVNPFTHPAKRLKYRPSEHRYQVRWIDRIEPLPDAPAMCVTVDREDGLYQARDFIVTHNSAESAFIILWFMSTRPHCAGVVTANTQTQLRSKTWRELAVWHKRAINAHWFDWTATRFQAKSDPKTWGIDAIPWSEHNSEAFAGLHAQDVLVIYDEASAVADSIWEVTEGAMTTPGAFWLVYGNPTRNSGRFRRCFGKGRARWSGRQIDARTCKMANREELQSWVDEYGEDSDFVRVRVRGLFPMAASAQLIGLDLAEAAAKRNHEVHIGTPKILSIDVARFGTNQSVASIRQGIKLWPQIKWRGLDTMQLAARIVELIEAHRPAATFVDETGLGAGVVDRLRQLGYSVVGFNGGEKADRDDVYYNKRAEVWGRMREWLRTADIPDERELIDDITGPEYYFDFRQRMQLEKKEDMEKRGLASPDCGDSLAMSFAYKVGPSTMSMADLMPEQQEDY